MRFGAYALNAATAQRLLRLKRCKAPQDVASFSSFWINRVASLNSLFQPAIVDIEKGQVENEPPSNGKQLSALPAPEAAFTSNAVHQSSARPSNERFRLVLLYVVQFAGLGACIAGVVLVWYFMGWEFGVPAVLIALLAVLIASGKWRWFYIAAVTAPRDVK